MNTKKIFSLALAALVLSFAAGCNKQDSQRTVEDIKKSGTLKVGVKGDLPGFSLQNSSGNYEGLEIDIARLFAQDIFGDASKVTFTPVTAKTRGPLIDNGDVDMIIATFTITEERKLSYNFTTPYYTDAVGILVLKKSGIQSLKDCDGKTIGVVQSATSMTTIKDASEKLGIKVKFQEYATYPEIKAALDSGRVDVFSVDKVILNGYLDSASIILPDTFAPQPYGVVTKLSNKVLAAYTDMRITEWLKNGVISSLIEKYKL
jgi:putative glutamine transport system substrate-binding protein